MAKNDDSKINIAYLNEELFNTNPSLLKLDRNKFAHASVLLKSDTLATYLMSSQTEKNNLPVLNVGSDLLPIIDGINKRVVTLGELANYFVKDIDELYEVLKLTGFDLSKIKPVIRKLEIERKAYIELSEAVGEVQVELDDETISLTLIDICNLKHISFEKLYNTYLLCDMNINRALREIEKKEKLAKDIKKLRNVIDLRAMPGEAVLKKYRRMVAHGRIAKLKFYTAMDRGVEYLGFDDVTQVVEMFLTNVDEEYENKPVLSVEERVEYLEYLAIALEKSIVDTNCIRRVISLSSNKRLEIDLNTLSYVLANKSIQNKRDFLRSMVKCELRKITALSNDPDLIKRLETLDQSLAQDTIVESNENITDKGKILKLLTFENQKR
jgi:hypothetical protein